MSENVDGWTADIISSSMTPRLRGAKTSDITPIINLRDNEYFVCLAQDLNQ